MDATFALTIIGTLFALYAILPEQKRARIGYAFGVSDKICIFLLIILMFISLLSGIFYNVSYGKDLVYPVTVFLGMNLQFVFEFTYILTGTAILIIIISRLVSKKVEIRNFDYFLDIIDNCFNEKKYPVLIALLDENYGNIFNDQEDEFEKDEKTIDELFMEIFDNFQDDLSKKG